MFYYIFAHKDLSKYLLENGAKYNSISGQFWEDNAEQYSQLMAAMKMVGFSDEEQDQFFRVLATCIHLSNVDFSGDEKVI